MCERARGDHHWFVERSVLCGFCTCAGDKPKLSLPLYVNEKVDVTGLFSGQIWRNECYLIWFAVKTSSCRQSEELIL
jgi:hypothetical protein